jgi:chromosome segregation ATPase
MRRALHAIAFLLCLPAFDAAAVELYRYINEQGVPVISYSIPPELVHKGYTVLSEDGRVIRVVERELTPAEQVKRDAEQNAKKHDADLMRRYGSPRDVEADLNRRLAELDQSIARAKQEVDQSKNRLARYQREAADAERSGRTPTPATLDNIERARKQIETYTKELEQRLDEREKLIEQFEKDAERIRELYNLPAED